MADVSVAPLLSHTVAGPAMAAGIAMAARWARSLSTSGAMAATAVGTVATLAGWSWGGFLAGWFIVASAASRAGRRHKEAATGDVVAKGGQRDAWQVLANGGVFAMCAAAAVVRPEWAALAATAGASALVAAGADTLATETGTLWRGRPWSLRTLGPVPIGTSGAVSVPGTVGLCAGAILLALLARACGLISQSLLPLVALAGVAGAVADTVVGAWWQARRRCPACGTETEQNVHRCGTATRPAGGIGWLGNDAVNLLCTAVGAVAAAASIPTFRPCC